MSSSRFFACISSLDQCCDAIQSCTSTLTNSRVFVLCANTILAAGVNVLDFMLDQKMKQDEIEWNYFFDAPTRIVGLCLASIFLGWSVEQVIKTFKQEANENDANKLAAGKILTGSIASSSLYTFAQNVLTIPISTRNAGYVFASAVVNGLKVGTLMSTAGYFLQKLNYTLRPISLELVKYVNAGMAFNALKMLIDFMCDQMIKNDCIDWNEFISPERILVANLINELIQGALLGISFYSINKYWVFQSDQQGFMNKIRTGTSAVLATIFPIGVFIYSSLMAPINAANAIYIIIESVVNGVSMGLINANNALVIGKLAVDRKARQDRGDIESPRERLLPSPSQGGLFAGVINSSASATPNEPPRPS